MPSHSALSDDQIRELAAEILSRDEYYRPGVAEEAWRAVLERLLGFFDFLEALRVASPVLYFLILAGLLLAALALVLWRMAKGPTGADRVIAMDILPEQVDMVEFVEAGTQIVDFGAQLVGCARGCGLGAGGAGIRPRPGRRNVCPVRASMRYMTSHGSPSFGRPAPESSLP